MSDFILCSVCKCPQQDIQRFASHLRNAHGFSLSQKCSNWGLFHCGQPDCEKSFSTFYFLKRHLIYDHSFYFPRNTTGSNNNPLPGTSQGGDSDTDNENMQLDVDNEQLNEMNIEGGEKSSLSLKGMAARLICNLRARGSVTNKIIQDFMTESGDLFTDMTSFFSAKVTDFLAQKKLLNDDDAIKLLESFDIPNPFGGMKSIDDQISVLKEEFNYIEPVEIYLGSRIEQRLGPDGEYIPQRVPESCQYVPVKDVLKMIMQNEEAGNYILSEKRSPNENILESFRDGHVFENHEFFQKYLDAFRLQLYYDEFEITNPLGSKTGVHKIGAIYYEIQNLPQSSNGVLGCVHVLLLCAYPDIQKYGFKKILQPFLDDLKDLESDEGVSVTIDNQEFTIRASIAALCGDGLAVHQLMNLLCPSATRFCRLCLVTRQQLHSCFLGPFEMRTKENYTEHVVLSLRNRAEMSNSGVRGECPLHASKFWHLIKNFVFDPTHDLLEGECQFLLKLVLNQFIINDELFPVDYLNSKIRSFVYGQVNVKNKPSANFTRAMLINLSDHKIKQRAAQTWLLMRVLPFLVYEKVQCENEYMEIFVLLSMIVQFVFSPKIAKTMLPYLRALVQDYCTMFKRLFSQRNPPINPINKQHHLLHYADCMYESGPMRHLNCLKYERKHLSMKKYAQIACNFKNLPMTLIRVAQACQAALWGKGDFKLTRIQCSDGQNVTVDCTFSQKELIDLNFLPTDKVMKCNSLIVNGTTYKLDYFVSLTSACQTENNLPIFGKIVEIILKEKTVFLNSAVYNCDHYDQSLNAFCIKREVQKFSFVKLSDLAEYKPLCVWKTAASQLKEYICPQHVL